LATSLESELDAAATARPSPGRPALHRLNRAEYANAVRFVFVPVIILSGFWMYSGIVFAVIGVAVWLGAYYFVGIGTAILSQVALFVARKIYLMVRARQSE